MRTHFGPEMFVHELSRFPFANLSLRTPQSEKLVVVNVVEILPRGFSSETRLLLDS
jgi:hypothetical protein